MRSQTESILEHLKTDPNGITSLEALQMFNCMRLGARIFDLKRAGHTITRQMEVSRSGAIYARYKLNRNSAA